MSWKGYTDELRLIIDEIAAGLPEDGTVEQAGRQREDRAILLLAMLSGGVAIARAVSDPVLSERIAILVSQAALSKENTAN